MIVLELLEGLLSFLTSVRHSFGLLGQRISFTNSDVFLRLLYIDLCGPRLKLPPLYFNLVMENLRFIWAFASIINLECLWMYHRLTFEAIPNALQLFLFLRERFFQFCELLFFQSLQDCSFLSVFADCDCFWCVGE